MKKIIVVTAFLLSSLILNAQDNGIHRMEEFARENLRQIINIPNVGEYKVLKADFHMHTVFSDGQVWPQVRVQEAWQEGLDAISLTEHVEILPFRHDVKVNTTRSYDLVKNLADENNILLIKGTEITRNTPPGHFNAIFINNSDGFIAALDSEKDDEAIAKVIDQNAFIIWDHPGWKANTIDGSYEWVEFVDRLHKSKALGGIEVFNGFSFFKKALDWAIDKDLAVIGNSDIHSLIAHTYDLQADHVNRTMTLVLAKERTEESIREALNNGRTIAWSSKYLAGKEEYVISLFNACVSISTTHHSAVKKDTSGEEQKVNYYEVNNKSDLFFELELADGDGTERIILYPSSSQVITAVEGQDKLNYKIVSAFVRSDQHPVITFSLR